MQMGVTVVMVVEPVGNEARASLKKIEHVTPIVGKVEGSGPMFAFSHNSNAADGESVNDMFELRAGRSSASASRRFSGGRQCRGDFEE